MFRTLRSLAKRPARDVHFSPDAPSLPGLALFCTICHLTACCRSPGIWLCFAQSTVCAWRGHSPPSRGQALALSSSGDWLCFARSVVWLPAGCCLFLRDWLCFAYSATWQLVGFPAFRQAGAFRHSCHSALFRISIFRFRVCQRTWYINHTPVSRGYQQQHDFLAPITSCPARTNETAYEKCSAAGVSSEQPATNNRL